MSKVISIDEKRKNKDDQHAAENQVASAIANHVNAEMVASEAKVQEMTAWIEKAVASFADTLNKDEKLDISIAIDAISRTALYMSLDFDDAVEEIEPHYQVREKIIQSLTSTIEHITELSPTPVYAHDIYVSLLNVVIIMARRFRQLAIVQKQEEVKSYGEFNNEPDGGR